MNARGLINISKHLIRRYSTVVNNQVQFALDAKYYYDKQVYQTERVNIFSKEWIYVGTKFDVIQPGQYLSVNVAGWPIFIIKDRNEKIQAFHNVCRHRAGPLVWSDNEKDDKNGYHKGRCEVLRCKYHGWLYDTNGNLKKAINFGADIDTSEYNLKRVRVEEWKGLLFINFNENAISLENNMQPITDILTDYPFEEYELDVEETHDLECNWKTYVDNYQEGYHIPIVHPELHTQIKSKEYEVIVHEQGKFCVHKVPPKNESSQLTGVWLWKYPNLMINAYHNGVSIERATPINEQFTKLQYTYLFKRGIDQKEKESNFNGSDLLTVEDKRIVEAVQRNLNAGIYHKGPLSPVFENGVAAFHRWVRESNSNF